MTLLGKHPLDLNQRSGLAITLATRVGIAKPCSPSLQGRCSDQRACEPSLSTRWNIIASLPRSRFARAHHLPNQLASVE
jgi:hypothetical protein